MDTLGKDFTHFVDHSSSVTDMGEVDCKGVGGLERTFCACDSESYRAVSLSLNCRRLLCMSRKSCDKPRASMSSCVSARGKPRRSGSDRVV